MIARKTVAQYKPQAFVFGSLGPLIESYRPDLIMSHEEGIAVHQRMIKALAQYLDAFLAETLSSVEESMQPVDALAKNADDSSGRMPLILISYTLNSAGELRSGENVLSAIPKILDYADDRRVKVLAIMFNCCEPEASSAALRQIQSNAPVRDKLDATKCLLGAYANRLTPVASDWSTIYAIRSWSRYVLFSVC